jgi:hypothetical protein
MDSLLCFFFKNCLFYFYLSCLLFSGIKKKCKRTSHEFTSSHNEKAVNDEEANAEYCQGRKDASSWVILIFSTQFVIARLSRCTGLEVNEMNGIADDKKMKLRMKN